LERGIGERRWGEALRRAKEEGRGEAAERGNEVETVDGKLTKAPRNLTSSTDTSPFTVM